MVYYLSNSTSPPKNVIKIANNVGFNTSAVNVGLDKVYNLGDGYTIGISWFRAYPSTLSNKIAYNIYYSTNNTKVFCEGPKYLYSGNCLSANIISLTPGQEYFFSIRPIEYDPTIYNLDYLPIAYDNLKYYPSSILSSNITTTSLNIPLVDIVGFPTEGGVVEIGEELVEYSSISGNSLLLNNISQRGFFNTEVRYHNVDGYDGYKYEDPNISYYVNGESSLFDNIYMCQCRFEYPHYAYTAEDGYYQVTKDYLTTDLSASDTYNQNFPAYDYAGYHRTDPVALLTGKRVGSYIGGQQYCLDGYGVGRQLRGLSLQDANNQREEMLLSITGRPAVLIKMVRTGIVCSCYLPSSEYPDDRCVKCLGTKEVLGWEQFFDPRRSDGRILVRPSAADDDLKMYEGGLESEFQLELWTLTVPTIKDRDIIILFDQDDNEEFRYEVLSVTRNNTIVGLMGAQKMKVQRIRKYDVAYQIPIFRNTSDYPTKIMTTLSSAGGIPPHAHQITKNENDPSTWAQLTTVVAGHNHQVVYCNNKLEILKVLGHTHQLNL